VGSQWVPRPFLKWAGGKTQLSGELDKRTTCTFNCYHEPFIGGGAFFFKLYREHKIRTAYLSDLNIELIDAYTAVRDQVEAVIQILAGYPHSKSFYYDLRAQDPWAMDKSSRTARMIYLNKTGYNGLYRVSKQGKFNVPFGRYKNPGYCDEANLRAVSQALQNIELSSAAFEKVLEKALPGDFVYFDPPYVPVSKTANFTAYHANGFTENDQIKLRDVCIELTQRRVKIMLSNSATDRVRTLYSTPDFFITEVQASRAINSNGKGRGKLAELIITNYPPEGGDKHVS
jgi:DNA adenine methylase